MSSEDKSDEDGERLDPLRENFPRQLFRIFTGGTSTLVANLFGLFVACIIVVEGRYIVYSEIGIFRPFDVWAPFVPVLFMFVVRRRKFSYFFLFLHVALATQMFLQARRDYLGLYKWGGEKEPTAFKSAFFAVSVLGLGVYLIVALMFFVFSILKSKIRK